MSVTIVTTERGGLVVLSEMQIGQAFLDSDNDVLIRTAARDVDGNAITVMQLDTGELYELNEASKYPLVKVEAKIVT